MKIMYNEKLDMLGILYENQWVRIYVHENARTWMVLTESWKQIGVL